MSEAVINNQQNMLCFEDKTPLKMVNMRVLSEKELNAEIKNEPPHIVRTAQKGSMYN